MYIPWLKIDRVYSFLGFNFVPITRDVLPHGLGDGDIGVSLKALFSRYVDHMGKPSDDHTVILRDGADPFWATAESDLEDAFLAANMFGFASLCEREFFGHDAHRINSTAFRSVAQKLSPPSTAMTITRHSIDGGIMDGGYKFEDMLQQMPIQRAYSRFSEPDERLLEALEKCRAENAALWQKICNATSIWMMANSEDLTLLSDAVLTLSAIAFENLVSGENAKDTATKFSKIWGKYASIFGGQSARFKGFERLEKEPVDSSLIAIWMFRFHKHRSAFAHNGGPKKSWEPKQFAVLQAFTFGWTVKLILAKAGLLELTDGDEDTLFAFEELLEHWNLKMEHWAAPLDQNAEAKYTRKRWYTILSTFRGYRRLQRTIERVIEESIP